MWAATSLDQFLYEICNVPYVTLRSENRSHGLALLTAILRGSAGFFYLLVADIARL